MHSQNPYLRLVADNSGSRLAILGSEERFIDDDPALLAKTKNPEMDPLGEFVPGAPVADSARANPKNFSGSRGAAQRIDDFADRLHARIFSRCLNFVKWLELEMICRRSYGRLKPMKQRAELVEIYDSRTIASIALRLRLTRQALGWNQTQLCDFTDIAPNTYNQWEQAKGRPELDKAMLLCDKLALTLDWIYRGNAAHLPHDLAMKISNLAGDLREAS